jgi:hypothetical protein
MQRPLDFGHSVKGREAELLVSCNLICGNRQPLDLRPWCEAPLRVISHMSQEPWPCNGEDPWPSSKGRIMGVGKVVLCSHGPSSTMWSDNGPYCGTIAYFLLAEKEERIWFNIICLKLYQFERITWWCLFALESVLKFALQFVLLEIILTENHGLQEFGGEPDENFGRPRHLIHSLPYRIFIHKVFFGPLGLHLRVWSELGRSPPFQPMRALILQLSWAFSLVCEVALRGCLHHGPWRRPKALWNLGLAIELVPRPLRCFTPRKECRSDHGVSKSREKRTRVKAYNTHWRGPTGFAVDEA